MVYVGVRSLLYFGIAVSRPVYSEGLVHAMAEKCSTCIFRPGNLMHLSEGRVKEMVDSSVANAAGITCHKTLPYAAEGATQQAVCRGFFDGYKDRVPALTLAEKMNIIKEVHYGNRT